MTKRISLLLAIMLIVTLACGCSRHPEVAEIPEAKESITITDTDTDTDTTDTLIQATPSWDEADYGIRLGKTYINDFYPGCFVDSFTSNDAKEGIYKKGDPAGIIIVNNMDEARHYTVTVEQPNELEPGYSQAPDYVLEDWVRISDPNPTLEANETRLIPISLWMPPDAEVFAEKWEFRIRVKDIDQTAFAQVMYEAKWLITMWDGCLEENVKIEG